MAVKKGILDNFLKPSSHYADNQKNLRSIFIDKTEDDLKPDDQNFLESSLLNQSSGTQLEHKKNTSGTQNETQKNINNEINQIEKQKLNSEWEHNWNTIGTQKEHVKNIKRTHQEHTLSYLTGIQKKLLVFLYLSCKTTKSRTTEEFSLIHMANTLDIKTGSIKNSLRRLEEKGFLINTQFKKGRGGWTKFEIPDQIYRELLEKEHNWNTIGTHQEHKSVW